MDIARPFPSTVSGISFSFISTEEARRISVKQIVNPVLLDDLKRRTIGGLYDPALGPIDKQDMYVTFFFNRTAIITLFLAVRHASSLTSPALVTLATSSCLLQCSIHFSFRRCLLFYVRHACFVIDSR